MAEYNVGSLLPNLKISVGKDDMTITDSSDVADKDIPFDATEVEIVRPIVENLQHPKIYLNKDGGFTTGIDLIAEENSGILNKRAERFGLDTEESKPTISSLYESMGIDVKNKNSAKMKHIRLDTMHLRGVQELTTDDVLLYFQDYGPKGVEWINDNSCNVAWYDEASCARAFLRLTTSLPSSFPIQVMEKTNTGEAADKSSVEHEANKDEEKMDIDDSLQHESQPLDIPIPPGQWRFGLAQAKTILFRFATTADKKLPGAEKRSKFYQKHGNPNYGGLKGLISSSRKHKVQVEANRLAVQKGSSSSYKSFSSHQSDVSIPKIAKQKTIRMRMYADDEELKAKKSRSKSQLNEKKRSVHSRLGAKYTADDLSFLGRYQHLDSQPNDFRADHDLNRQSDDFRANRDLDRNYTDFKSYQDLDRDSNDSRSYRDLDRPSNDFRSYRDLDRPADDSRSYRDLDRPSSDSRSHRDPDRYSSYPRSYESGKFKSRNSTLDLRSKLKRSRDNKQAYAGLYSRKYDEDKDYGENAGVKSFRRVDELKKSSRSIYKRKHRSPLCADDDDEEDEEDNYETSSGD